MSLTRTTTATIRPLSTKKGGLRSPSTGPEGTGAARQCGNRDIRLRTTKNPLQNVEHDEISDCEVDELCGNEELLVEENPPPHQSNDKDSLSWLYDMSIYDQEVLSSTPLYNGARLTVMDALVKHLSWFSEHPSISKEALSDVLRMEHLEILPPGNNLPSSYNDAMKVIEPFLIQPIMFHACPNDCIIFRGDHTDLETCPTCGANRYKQTGIPAKRFTYLPVGPRLVRLFGTSNLAKIVQAHGLHHSTKHVSMYDIHDSPTWKLAYSTTGEFGSEYRSISFAFNTDGVNPYSQNRVSYSMWPIMLTVLNLPRKIRYNFGNFWFVGTVPGNGNHTIWTHILIFLWMNY